MVKQKSIKQIIGNKYVLVGLIFGASVGYIGSVLCYFVHYLFYKEIAYTPFFTNLIWGIFLLCLWFRLTKKIQNGSLK